jgi:hypothetical protein
LKIKIKGHYFYTTEAELQAMLNTVTEHDFQDVFKKMAEALGTVHTRGRRLLREGWWPEGPKLVFDPEGSTSPENDGCLFIPVRNLYHNQ